MTNIPHIQYQTISVGVEGNEIPDIILDSISGCDIFSWKWNWVGMSWGFWTIEQCGPGPGTRWSPGVPLRLAGGQTIQQQESYMAPASGTTPLTKHIYGHSSQWSSHCSSAARVIQFWHHCCTTWIFTRCGEIVMLVRKTSTAFSKNQKFLKLPRLWISISMYKYILSKLDNAICSIAACCRQMCPGLLQVLSSPRLAQMFHSRSCLFLDCSLHCFSIQYFRLWKFGTPHTEKLGRFITM